MLKIPKKLKIGAITYKILVGSIDDCGECDTKTQTIKIDESMSEELTEVTFWHEVLHAINISLTEKEVEFLAQAIVQVRRDNNLYTK